MDSESNKELDVVTADGRNSNTHNDKQEIDETEALKLYIAEMTKLFRHGVSMGFLVKTGDNYHWNVKGDEYCYQT